MTVESNYLIAIVMLSDWLKNLGRVFQPIKSRPKSIVPCMHDFSCALSKLEVIAWNSDLFVTPIALVVIGQNNYFGIGLQQSFENYSILCIVIYPLHRTIQPLNNLGQQYSGQYVQIHHLIWTNHTHETKKNHYGILLSL